MKARKWVKALSVMVLSVLTVMALRGMGAPVAATAVTPVNAGDSWYACTVARANAGHNSSYVQLTNVDGNPLFALKWFALPQEKEAEMMALASDAIRMEEQVYVHVNIHDGIFPKIYQMSVRSGETKDHV